MLNATQLTASSLSSSGGNSARVSVDVRGDVEGQPLSEEPEEVIDVPDKPFQFPIETPLPTWCRKLRVSTLFPMSLIQQVLLLVAVIQDFVLYSETRDKVVPIHHLNGTRSAALWALFARLIAESLFLVAALYYGGLDVSQIKRLLPVAGYHIGFIVLTGRINFQALDYMAGFAFIAFLSELCCPLRLLLNYYLTAAPDRDRTEGTPRSNSSSTIWQMRLLYLEIFMLGACMFVSIFVYGILLGTEGILTTQTKRYYTIVLTLAILYWTIQVAGYQRHKFEQLMHSLQQPQQQQERQSDQSYVN